MTTAEIMDPLDELGRENEVAERLTERLAETAIALTNGESPSPGWIAEGLLLLDQYRAVHSERVVGDLRPEAQPVAMSGCFQHLDTIASDYPQEKARIESAQRALQDFTSDPEGARAGLATALADLTEKKHESLVYENDYPLSCLRAALPEDASARLSTAFRRTDAELYDLERHIAQYLAGAPGSSSREVRVRCGHPSCGAVARSRLVPSNAGRLGIEVPEGWGAVAGSPVVEEGRTIRVDVAFRCPEHRGESGGSMPVPPEACTCCDPIPVDTP